MVYEFLKHTADVKFRAKAKSLAKAFEESASALFETMRGNMQILELKEKEISVDGENLENLLYNFLEEFLFLLDSEDFLVAEIKSLEIDDKNYKLKMKVSGDAAKNYHFTNDVKAITYSDMRIERGEEVVITGVFDV